MTDPAPVVPRVVIVGAGAAGASAARALIAGGFVGEIALIGEERGAPYDRSRLSKGYLAGEETADALVFETPEALEAKGVRLLSHRRAIWIDRANRRVRLDGGQELGFDHLILAMGGKPKPLRIAGADLPGVFSLYTMAEADQVRLALNPGAKVVVVGAGLVGLEAAATCRRLGLEVTVIEPGLRPAPGQTSAELAGALLDKHTAQGVRFALSAPVALIKGADKASAVALADGASIAADCVIADLSIAPETGLAERSGLDVAEGILVDAQRRTSDPYIFAAGACARPRGSPARTLFAASVAHNDSAIAAAAILGRPAPAAEPAIYVCEHYDWKVQILAPSRPPDRILRRAAAGTTQGFTLVAVADGIVVGAEAVNDPSGFAAARTWAALGVRPDAP